MFDYFLIFLIFLICLGGSWLSVGVRNNEYPFYLSAVSGFLISIIWIYIVKWSKSNLIVISAWIDVACSLGYFVGFFICGQAITLHQLVGIILLTIGLYLVI
jgi:hypothetical protein